MFSQADSPWVLLVIPFAFLIYVVILLGVLWIATRVVKHAWYWRSSSGS